MRGKNLQRPKTTANETDNAAMTAMESRDTIVKAATPLARSKGSESVHGAILGYVQKGENREDAQHREDGEKGLFNMSARNKPRVRGGAYRSDRSFIEHLATQFESRAADIALKPGVTFKPLVIDT